MKRLLIGIGFFFACLFLPSVVSAQVNYGVDIDTGSGVVSGYAWNDGVGWIDFNGVSYNTGNGDLTGTAVIVELVNQGQNGTVEMSGDCVPSCGGYGVNVDTGTGAFSGNAWNDTIGWIDFLPPFGGVNHDGTETPSVSGWAWNDNIGWIQMRHPQSPPPPPPPTTNCTSSPFNTCLWAWSDTIGWISHNETDNPSTPLFGVDIDEGAGTVTGFAWNDILGYIDFDNATYDPGTGEVSGTASILDLGAAGTLVLRGDCTPSCGGYGVDAPSGGGTVTGYAWNDILGWIDFQPAFGGVTHNDEVDPSLTGWAWNDSYGWIAMRNEVYDVDYGVHIDDTGNVTGYAWSRVGWLHYDPAGPYPSAPANSARWDPITGDISGWALFVGLDGQGADGWVLLRDSAGAVPYGVHLDDVTGEWTGQAWSDTIGWISYDHIFNDTLTDVPSGGPTAPTLDSPNDCTQLYTINPLNPLTPTLDWSDYAALDGTSQDAFEIQVADNDPTFQPGNLVVNYNSDNPPPNLSGDVSQYTLSLAEALQYERVYYWRVRVKSSDNEWSEWGTLGPGGESNCFLTPLHAPPVCDFSLNPPSPVLDNPTQFNDLTQVFDPPSGAPTTTISQWDWTFGDGNTLTGGDPGIHQNPEHTYIVQQPVTVELTVTDSSGYECTETKNFTVQQNLPEFRRVIPR